MGGLSKAQFRQFKALLQLTDEAIEIADRYGIQESLLRSVLHLAPEDQVEVMRQIVQFGLTRNQIRALIEGSQEEGKEQDGTLMSRQVTQFARLMNPKHLPDAYHLALALIDQEKDKTIARARVQMLRKMLDEAESYLSQ